MNEAHIGKGEVLIAGETEHERDVVRRFHLDHLRDSIRYRWLRMHPAFDTELFLGGLTPEEFDAVVDERMREGT